MKNKRKMKKILMIASMVLMVALVAGMGTITYSRYVSSSSMAEPAQATVAKWGYVVTINADSMFGEKYEDGQVSADAAANDVSAVVEADAVNDRVAPGTSGSMTISVNGVAEVLAQLSIAVGDNFSDVALYLTGNDTAVHTPIKWTLKEDGSAVPGCENVALATIITTLEGASATIAAGSNVAYNYELSWSWALDSDNNATTTDDTDLYDTALGMLAAGKTADEVKAATGLDVDAYKSVTAISVQISASVVQIQD